MITMTGYGVMTASEYNVGDGDGEDDHDGDDFYNEEMMAIRTYVMAQQPIQERNTATDAESSHLWLIAPTFAGMMSCGLSEMELC